MALARYLVRFGRDESGATAIEYGLIVGLVFLVVVGGITTFSSSFNVVMSKASAVLGVNLK